MEPDARRISTSLRRSITHLASRPMSSDRRVLITPDRGPLASNDFNGRRRDISSRCLLPQYSESAVLSTLAATRTASNDDETATTAEGFARDRFNYLAGKSCRPSSRSSFELPAGVGRAEPEIRSRRSCGPTIAPTIFRLALGIYADLVSRRPAPIRLGCRSCKMSRSRSSSLIAAMRSRDTWSASRKIEGRGLLIRPGLLSRRHPGSQPKPQARREYLRPGVRPASAS
jgi:hypothetical protein